MGNFGNLDVEAAEETETLEGRLDIAVIPSKQVL